MCTEGRAAPPGRSRCSSAPGFRRTVDHGIAALQRATPDLVLLDLQLPGKPGEALLAWVRARTELARLPVVAVTARPPEVGESTLGLDGWLSKPVSRQAC